MAENLNQDGRKDLTVSQIDRQNILNNPFALKELEQASKVQGIEFEGKSVLKKMGFKY